MKNIESPAVLRRGTRVYIRYPSKADAEELIALNQSSVALHHPWVSPPTSYDEFAMYMERSRRDDMACFLICLNNSEQIIGAVNLSQIFRGNFQSAYMGYYIGAKYAGQGYMTEAVGLVLDYAFGPMKLHRIEANVQPDNYASRAVVLRLQFTLEGYSRRYLNVEGEWRDHERWAMLAEDWAGIRAQQAKEHY